MKTSGCVVGTARIIATGANNSDYYNNCGTTTLVARDDAHVEWLMTKDEFTCSEAMRDRNKVLHLTVTNKKSFNQSKMFAILLLCVRSLRVRLRPTPNHRKLQYTTVHY